MRIQLLWGGKDNMTDRKGTSSNNDHRMIVLSNGNNRETSAVIQAKSLLFITLYTPSHSMVPRFPFSIEHSIWNRGIFSYRLT